MKNLMIVIMLLFSTTTFATHVTCNDKNVKDGVIKNTQAELIKKGFDVPSVEIVDVKEDARKSTPGQRACVAFLKAELKQPGIDVKITYIFLNEYPLDRKTNH